MFLEGRVLSDMSLPLTLHMSPSHPMGSFSDCGLSSTNPEFTVGLLSVLILINWVIFEGRVKEKEQKYVLEFLSWRSG